MNLQIAAGYEHLVAKARAAHAAGRSPAGITDADVALARMYCYAFRMHTIGAFHGTREALKKLPGTAAGAIAHLQRAQESLEDLANQAMDPVPNDFRSLLSTFHRYDRSIGRAIDAMQQAFVASRDAAIDAISDRFVRIVGEISGGNGLHVTRDLAVPEQASFIVPNLGITIVPLAYGDHHSWNIAFLSKEHLNVPLHRHHEGVEIHLGYSPLQGCMVLGERQSPVDEGYALPIPPMTRHGWVNTSGQVHHVPFIFGSLKHGGWGVFLDVEPQPMEFEQLENVDRASGPMMDTVFLEREIEAVARSLGNDRRRVLIPGAVTDRNGSGGLELTATRIDEQNYQYPAGPFRIISIVRGQGVAAVAGLERHVTPHDHFFIPAGLSGSLHATGADPLVALDCVIQ